MTVERSYRRGDAGPAVAEIRTKLRVLGLLPSLRPAEVGGEPPVVELDTATFDEDTDRAVRAFQQQRGILVDGIVGPVTYHALDEARWRLGDRILFYVPGRLMAGDDVAALQQRLLDMGFDLGRVDGLFGVETEQALREFQRNVGLVADGTCGPATFKALDRLSRTVTGGSPQAMRESEAITSAGSTLAGKLVIVDPGHGGPDPDALSAPAETHQRAGPVGEGRLMYDLASRVEGRLTATGASAFLTRGPEPADAELSAAERAAFANAAGADLLISLHTAAHANPEARGVATFYWGNDRLGHHSTIGQRFASLVQREICARTDLLDCRTHAINLDLLRRTRMPAVRLEVGYLTNPGDAARLRDPQFRDVVAEAIVVAVQRLYLPPEEDAQTGFLRIPALLG